MEHFYLTLLSNASNQFYEGNTIAYFRNKLPRPYKLDGEWEVGLKEISFPPLNEGINQQKLQILEGKLDMWKGIRPVDLPNGVYDSFTKVLDKAFASSRDSLILRIHFLDILNDFTEQASKISLADFKLMENWVARIHVINKNAEYVIPVKNYPDITELLNNIYSDNFQEVKQDIKNKG